MECGSHLRVIALASVVALAGMLPLAAATAGPAGPGRTVRVPHDALPPNSPSHGSRTPRASGLAGGQGLLGASALGLVPTAAEVLDDGKGAGGRQAPRTFTECGPQLKSPEGVEAQTCVLTRGPDTFARTYYRNPTGRPLSAVMTLMRPDGRTVVVHCSLVAVDEPGTCDSPRERGVRGTGAEPYDAVTEIASATRDRMLLRTGSEGGSGGS